LVFGHILDKATGLLEPGRRGNSEND